MHTCFEIVTRVFLRECPGHSGQEPADAKYATMLMRTHVRLQFSGQKTTYAKTVLIETCEKYGYTRIND